MIHCLSSHQRIGLGLILILLIVAQAQAEQSIYRFRFANKPFVAHNIISCLDQRDTQHSPTSSRMMSATTSSGRVCQPIDQHLRALCRNLIIEERSAMVNDKGAVVVGIMVIAVITAMAMASTNINTMTNSNDHSKL